MLYVSKVRLRNFRCFEDVTLEPDVSAGVAPWILLTGDNASGKTTLLKAIALGLCDRSSAAGLLRESESGYIRHSEELGSIRIELADPRSEEREAEYWIETTLQRDNRHMETLDQKTKPNPFPWDDIFVCGYGAGRGTSGTGDIAGYTAINAVYNLFNYTEGLQNPELTIRRRGRGRRQDLILDTLKNITKLEELQLAENGSRGMGISVRDDRKAQIALRDMADGYKSTFLWITDFLGWALESSNNTEADLRGIVIIDEIEQHLHPRWQRRIIPDLKTIWPSIQFFAATHSPLVTRSFQTFDHVEPHQHYHLRNGQDGNNVEAVKVPPLGNHRTDQILATEAFDFLLDADPDAERILEELSLLVGNEFLTKEEKERVDYYLEQVRQIQSIRTGQTQTERSAAELIELTQQSLTNRLEQQLRGSQSDTN